MSLKDTFGFSPKTKAKYEDSKMHFSLHQTKHDLSSDEETKVIESGGGCNNNLETISSTSSDNATICERCSSEDASVVWIQWENVYLCLSCDDLIHSIGVYKKHNRVDVLEFAKSKEKSPINIQGEIELFKHNSDLTKEERELTYKLQTKLESLSTKVYEWEVAIKSYETKEKELEINYESSWFNVENNMKYLRELIQNKERELVSELKAIKEEKANEILTLKQKIKNLKSTIVDVWEILREGKIFSSNF